MEVTAPFVTRDAEGRVLSQSIVSPTFETVFAVTHLYNDAGHLILTTDGVGNVTEYVRDGAGRATREIVKTPAGVIASWKEWFYNLENELVWAKTGTDSFTWYEYDAAGNVTKETVKNAAGQVVTWIDRVYYPGSGLLWKSYDANGNSTVYTYNGAGQVKTEKTWDVTLAAYISDKVYEYDGGQLSALVNVGVNRTEWTYNAGRKISEKVLDANGQLDAVVYFAYDSAGNLDTVTDGANRVTKYAYNGAGLKESETVGFGTPKAATTHYDYDAAGRLWAVTDPADNTTYFGYDAAGRQTWMTDTFGYSVEKTYDDAGRLTSLTNRNNLHIIYSHDAAGRVTGETWVAADGSTVVETLSFGFDWAGNLLSATNSAGAYTMTPNPAGWVTQVAAPFDVTLTFGYDNAGNRTSVTDSFGGLTVSGYDALGNLRSRELGAPNQDTLKVTQLFNGAGQRTATERRVNGFVTSSTAFAPDGAGRSEAITHFDAFDIPQIGYSYAYNLAGDLLSKTDHGVVKAYAYDEHGQLTSDNGSGYSYDLNGNRTNPGYVTGAGNRIATDGTWSYSYDAEGNITGKLNLVDGSTWVYAYDHKNHLIRAEHRSLDSEQNLVLDRTADYVYDAFGNRIAKSVDWDGDGPLNPEVLRFALDGWNSAKATPVGNENWDVWADLDATGSLTTRYLRGDVVDEVFARAEAGFEYWYWNDAQGSMREVVDASGLVKDAIEYDAFGAILSESAPQFRGRYAWTGRELDAETGLYYLRGRFYSFDIGRFTSQDPLGFAAGDANLYRYVGNAPLTRSDPSGLQEPYRNRFVSPSHLRNMACAQCHGSADGSFRNLTGFDRTVRIPADLPSLQRSMLGASVGHRHVREQFAAAGQMLGGVVVMTVSGFATAGGNPVGALGFLAGFSEFRDGLANFGGGPPPHAFDTFLNEQGIPSQELRFAVPIMSGMRAGPMPANGRQIVAGAPRQSPGTGFIRIGEGSQTWNIGGFTFRSRAELDAFLLIRRGRLLPAPRTWTPPPNWQGPAASRGRWLSEEGNSIFRLSDETADAFDVPRGTEVRFVEGTPDYSPFVRPTPAGTSGVFDVAGLTGVHATDQPLIRSFLAEQAGISQAAVTRYLRTNDLRMHPFRGTTVHLERFTTALHIHNDHGTNRWHHVE